VVFPQPPFALAIEIVAMMIPEILEGCKENFLT